jgi:TolB-like protein/class 3 adenylate cyclase
MPESTGKLAAIVFTDIVGFTKLTADDQQKASDLLDLQRSELKPLVESHGGKWVKEVGDGLILTFDTITNAVQCCLKIQDKARSIENLSLRIGVHLGEILVKEGDIIGDDVNITARIEPFSAPGGIAISNKVNDALVREANFTTKYLGKPQLKGVGQEVKVYCITSHGLPETDLSKVTAKLENKSNWYIYVISAASVVLVAGFILLNPFGEEAPDNLSIAVLPFANMSTDKENEYFSDGMTEEILNALAQINTLRVAARTSSFAFKGKNEDIRIIGKKLAVAHVLEGSVRKFGEDIRITAQLIRVSDGYHLWSNTYDRKFKEIFKVQEEISNAIVGQMKIKLFGEDIVKRRGITEHPEALDLYMQGRFLWNQNQERAVLRSIEYFEKALEKDPKYALAESAIADGFYSLGVIKRWTVSNEERSIIFQKSEDHARKALRIEPQLGEAFAVLGVLYGGNQISSHWKDDKKTAEEYFKKAINLSPKYTPAYLWYSNMLSPGSKDRKEEAEIMFNKALAIDPLSASVNMRGSS